ncbi:MAG: hypothetical protein ACTSUE_11740, partial [Promethearchaeota archaeon]
MMQLDLFSDNIDDLFLDDTLSFDEGGNGNGADVPTIPKKTSSTPSKQTLFHNLLRARKLKRRTKKSSTLVFTCDAMKSSSNGATTNVLKSKRQRCSTETESPTVVSMPLKTTSPTATEVTTSSDDMRPTNHGESVTDLMSVWAEEISRTNEKSSSLPEVDSFIVKQSKEQVLYYDSDLEPLNFGTFDISDENTNDADAGDGRTRSETLDSYENLKFFLESQEVNQSLETMECTDVPFGVGPQNQPGYLQITDDIR